MLAKVGHLVILRLHVGLGVQRFGRVVQRVEDHVVFKALVVGSIASIVNHVGLILATCFFILTFKLHPTATLHADDY